MDAQKTPTRTDCNLNGRWKPLKLKQQKYVKKSKADRAQADLFRTDGGMAQVVSYSASIIIVCPFFRY